MLAPTLEPALANEDTMAYGPTPDPKLIAELTAALKELARLRAIQLEIWEEWADHHDNPNQ